MGFRLLGSEDFRFRIFVLVLGRGRYGTEGGGGDQGSGSQGLACRVVRFHHSGAHPKP